MSLLVTGSIGIDTVETPHGRAPNVLGGSAVYFSLAASLFGPVRLVGVVGDDFDHAMFDPLRARNIDLRGLEVRKGSRTFRWHGRYEGAMNEAHTVDVELNVLAERNAPIPQEYHDSRYVFLANTHPALQRECAEKMRGAKLIVSDTMNLWIENELDELKKTLKIVDGLVLNEGEARMLSGSAHLVKAGRMILDLGPKFVVIKKGENGSILVSRDDLCMMPAFPTTNVIDPTGCGDSFAGAFMGHIASKERVDRDTLRSAMGRGSIVASFVLESFSIQALHQVGFADVNARLEELRAMMRFE